MPSSATITTFYSFTANTKARASQVNSNFDLFRGHLVPIDPNTATAVNNTYDLGSTEWRWRGAYVKFLDFLGSTSSGSRIQIQGDTTDTSGGLLIQINSTTVFDIDSTGFSMANARPGTASTLWSVATITADGTWTVPTNTAFAIAELIGGGGGGGAGGNSGSAAGAQGGGGGGGGRAGETRTYVIYPTAGDVYTIDIGAGGSAGQNVIGNNGGDGGTGSITTMRRTTGGNTGFMFAGAGTGGTGGKLADDGTNLGTGGFGGQCWNPTTLTTASAAGGTYSGTRAGTDGTLPGAGAGGGCGGRSDGFAPGAGGNTTGGGTGGAAGSTSQNSGGGGGAGGSSTIAAGANGGAGGDPSAPANGSDGSANSGCGGGGGGGGALGISSGHAADGGAGGEGRVTIYIFKK